MEFLHIGADTLILVVLGILGWFTKTKIAEYDEHIRRCAQIPKDTIVSKLEDMCEHMDGLHDKISKVGDAQVATDKQIAILIGRQIERDKA